MPHQPPPRYVQLADTLIREIREGHYPVGGFIPTEFALCERFGMSRFTVRAAIRRLVQLGLVTRQSGVGTRVVSRALAAGYVQVIEDLTDLHLFTAETRLEIIRRQRVDMAGGLAEALDASPGAPWLEIEALRRANGGDAPLAHLHLYIHPDFADVDLGDTDERSPIYACIERQYGEMITEVGQRIEAMTIDSHSAALLGVKHGASALRVTRSYRDRRGRTVELAVNIHPAGLYSYSQTFRRGDRGRSS
jgi:DNA-binding GntR family transcriptional regulator